jgi:hypothetical protein
MSYVIYWNLIKIDSVRAKSCRRTYGLVSRKCPKRPVMQTHLYIRKQSSTYCSHVNLTEQHSGSLLLQVYLQFYCTLCIIRSTFQAVRSKHHTDSVLCIIRRSIYIPTLNTIRRNRTVRASSENSILHFFNTQEQNIKLSELEHIE